MPDRPLRLAIVGCGAIAEKGHLPAATRVPGVRLAALVDTDQEHARGLARQYGSPRVVGSLDEVLGEVDAVVLATPPHVRPRLARQAFGAGLHVLCEKPLANTSAECREILAAAEASGKTLAVAHSYRHCPNRQHAYGLLQRQTLGRLRSVRVEEGGPSDWPTRTGYTFRGGMVAGGVLLNLGIHALDTLFWWFGRPEEWRYEDDSLGGLESNVRIYLRFRGDLQVDLRMSRTAPTPNRVLVEGEAGSLSLPVYEQSVLQLGRGGKWRKVTAGPRKMGMDGMVTEQLRDFVESIRAGRPPRVTGADGLRVIEFIEACYAAKRSRPLPQRAPLPGVTW